MQTFRTALTIALLGAVAGTTAGCSCGESAPPSSQRSPREVLESTRASTSRSSTKQEPCTIDRALIDNPVEAKAISDKNAAEQASFRKEIGIFAHALDIAKTMNDFQTIAARVPAHEIVVAHTVYVGRAEQSGSRCLLYGPYPEEAEPTKYKPTSWAEYLALSVSSGLAFVDSTSKRDYPSTGIDEWALMNYLTTEFIPGEDIDEQRGVALAFATAANKNPKVVQAISAAAVKFIGDKSTRGLEQHLRFVYSILATDFVKLDRDVKADETAFEKAFGPWEKQYNECRKKARTPDAGTVSCDKIESEEPTPKYSFGYKNRTLGFVLRRWREPNGPSLVKHFRAIVEQIATGIGMSPEELRRPLATEE